MRAFVRIGTRQIILNFDILEKLIALVLPSRRQKCVKSLSDAKHFMAFGLVCIWLKILIAKLFFFLRECFCGCYFFNKEKPGPQSIMKN